MSDWRIRHRDADGRDAQSVAQLSREAAIVQPYSWSAANTAEFK